MNLNLTVRTLKNFLFLTYCSGNKYCDGVPGLKPVQIIKWYAIPVICF